MPAARVRGQPVVIRARAIGYQPGANPIALNAGSQTLDFNLKKDLTELSAVVVTGVTKATESVKLPFTVTRVDSSQMPVSGSNPITQLQGKIPGALIVNASGRPGAAPSIVLRGPVSLNATGRTQQPLYLLDGVPLQGALPDINPSDIEDVEVVKGAAAASLYGARAGAGVINITTKSGKNAPQGIRLRSLPAGSGSMDGYWRSHGGRHQRHRARIPARNAQCARSRSKRPVFLQQGCGWWHTGLRPLHHLGPGSSAHQ